MLQAKNNTIVINRGDTCKINLGAAVPIDYYDYVLKENDALYFGLMDPGQFFEEALIRKKFTAEDISSIGEAIIELSSEETVDLIPGKYFYAIKLLLDHKVVTQENIKQVDEVITLVNKTKFIICD